MQTFVNTVNFWGKNLKIDWQVKHFLVSVLFSEATLSSFSGQAPLRVSWTRITQPLPPLTSIQLQIMLLQPGWSRTSHFLGGFSKESRVPRLPRAEHKLFLSTQFGPRGFFLNKGREKRCLLSRQSEHCSNRLSTCRGLSFGLHGFE